MIFYLKLAQAINLVMLFSSLYWPHAATDEDVRCLPESSYCTFYKCHQGIVIVDGQPSVGVYYIQPPCDVTTNVTKIIWKWDYYWSSRERKVLSASFSKLPNLEEISIYGTQPVALWEDAALAQVKGIRVVRVANAEILTSSGFNAITSSHGAPFQDTSHLVELELKDMNLANRIHPSKFQNLTKLEVLNLDNNALNAIDATGIENVGRTLSTLSMEDNRLTSITWQDLDQLTNLQSLNLRRNRIEELVASPFQSASKLETLVLDNNRLTELSNDSLAGLSALEYLDLDNNNLRSIDKDAFLHTPNLVTIHLSGNRLTYIYRNTFQKLTKLAAIYLTSNTDTLACSGAIGNLQLANNTNVVIFKDDCPLDTTVGPDPTGPDPNGQGTRFCPKIIETVILSISVVYIMSITAVDSM